jgi:hypothetical protein
MWMKSMQGGIAKEKEANYLMLSYLWKHDPPKGLDFSN